MDKFYDKLQELEFYFVAQEQRKEPTQEDIRRLENKIGNPLPDDYKDFLIKYGRIAFGVYVVYPLRESSPYGDNSLLSVFFGFSSNGVYDIEKNLSIYQERMPSGFLPIASDPGGNIVVISTSATDKGKVYYWDHEHRELRQNEFQSMVSDLKSRDIYTENMSVDEIIMRWQYENQDKLDKPPGYSNVYIIADSFTEFFEVLEIEDDDEKDDDD